MAIYKRPTTRLRRPLRAVVVCNNDMMARQLEKLIDIPLRESADKAIRTKDLHDIQLVVSMRRSISTEQHNQWQAWAKKQGIPYIAANSGALLASELKNEYGLTDDEEPASKQEKKAAPVEIRAPMPVPIPVPPPAPVVHVAADPISVALRAVKEEYEKQLEQAKRDVDLAESLALKESERKDEALAAQQLAEQQVAQLHEKLSKLTTNMVPLEKLKTEMSAEVSARDKKINELVHAERKAEERLAKLNEQVASNKANMDRMTADLEIALAQAQTGTSAVDTYSLMLLEILALYLAKRPVYGKDIRRVLDELISKESSLMEQLKFTFRKDMSTSVNTELKDLNTEIGKTVNDILAQPGGSKALTMALEKNNKPGADLLRDQIKTALRAVKTEK